MGTIILFGLLGFVLELMALTYVKNKLFRWFPIIFLEGFILGGLVNARASDPTFSAQGFYQWLMIAAAAGAVLAWRFYRKHNRR